MVYIKRLEMRGFKSFGSRSVLVGFERGYTVITGPNGSGKSNILDAIVFCLGENNPKMLRVPKLTSLLYDGGAAADRPISLRVNLILDNSDRILPIDADGVTISRELAWSGESIYYLNGKRVQKNSITTLLDLAMLSPGGLNFVPQGRVTRLSELAPDEKRRLVEELAGVAQFEEKRTEATRQLHEADSRLQIALARIDEIRKRVESLEGERNDQLRLRQLEEEIRWLKGVLASERLAGTRRTKMDEGARLEHLSGQLSTAQERREKVRTGIVQVEAERNAFVTNVLGEEGGRYVDVQFAVNKAAAERENLQADLRRTDQVIEQAEAELPHLENSRQETTTALEDTAAAIRSMRTELTTLGQTRREVEREYSATRRSIVRFERRIETANRDRDRLNLQRQTLGEQLAHLDARIEMEKSRLSMTQDSLFAAQQRSKSFGETAGAIDDKLLELRRLKDAHKDGLEKTTGSLSAAVERHARASKEVDGALKVLREVEEVLIRQESQRGIAEKVAGAELGLRRVEEAARAGALEGYRGKLEDLISFSPGLAAAVSASAGVWLKAGVVENLTAMLSLVQLARRLRVGRIALIPLAEVSESERIRPPNLQGVTGNLAEVISVDGNLGGLVNFVFGGTILATSMQAAYLASAQGFRSVTPHGDLFEPSGRAFGTGIMTSLGSIIDMIYDDASITSIKAAFESLRGMVAKRKEDLDALETRSKKLEKDRLSDLLTVERLEAKIDTLTGFAAKYRRLRKGLENRALRLGREASRIQNVVNRLSNTQASIRTKQETLVRKLGATDPAPLIEDLRALTARRNSLADAVESASLKIRNALTELSRLEAALTNVLKPRLETTKARISELQTRLKLELKASEEGHKKLVELEDRHRSLREEEERLLDAKRKAMPILEEVDDRLKRLRNEEEEVLRQAGRLERDRFSSQRSLESLNEGEQRLLGELLLYGYRAPLEYFPAAAAMHAELAREYEELRSRVNLLAEGQYREIFSGYKNLSLRKNQLELERNAVIRFIESVDGEKRKVFVSTFERVDRELRSVFARLTGGAAWLELENPDDLFTSGVFLMTQFPNKPPRESGVTSGGEKAVASVSFILAIQGVQPSPIYVLDEADAHLDAVNSERLADLLRERSVRSQIIAASLKDTMVEKGDLVHGVYLSNGLSQIVRYRPSVEVTPRAA